MIGYKSVLKIFTIQGNTLNKERIKQDKLYKSDFDLLLEENIKE